MAHDPSEFPVQAAPFEQRLTNFAGRVKGGQARVVAIGSSTTAGEGGIAPYPQRLLADLRIKYPNVGIEVINRGVGGEEAPAELKRFDHDVFDLNPDLVIWQVGTNSVWQPADQNPPSFADTTKAIREGVDRLLDAERIDVILMDLQYVPALLTPAKLKKTEAMVEAISEIAHVKGVNVFGRFGLMKGWYDVARISFDRMVDPGDDSRLHASDWTTDKMTWQLTDAIVAAANKAPHGT
ncbi:lysophospholipase L1-like esterase [Bradyrhizobium sp. JR7.2]|uniref:GDSL-type esterase/lipase family protein n=2 Tax=Bradyrhizobium TaxID=374 RepID=A0ABY3QKB5_9BRAD|nr:MULTISPECIES: GDSL-type esterase/lipase family protein [Bradyrhizobium]UFW86429.1 GDSL-type esterase/lipase family protein [Bradyrhizobium japonicum]WFT94888.1 GDSL-type esterase/lipase family protein [Bradyrhizobium barranii]CUU21927.1 Lipolytic enzyme GDSL family precursor CDS [Bradyrhizobium sp.]